MEKKNKKVMVFGTFDGIHKGHLDFLAKAREKGDEMMIVVARDKTVLKVKNRVTDRNEKERIKALKEAMKDDGVEIVLGSLDNKYEAILNYKPDIICLGYDQVSFDRNLKRELSQKGLQNVEIERLESFEKWKFKSSKLKYNKSDWVRNTFRETAFREKLVSKGDKIILGVSGGPDSMAMLALFLEIKDELNLELIVAHVNYGLRDKDSDEDEKRVDEEAKMAGICFKTLKIRKKTQRNEAEMRKERYNFFNDLCEKEGFSKIAIAHNADDQVETIILRFLRGAGIKGLAGMKYKNDKIIRPLLDVEKENILAYLSENKIKYGLDKTNLQNEFLRNRVRNELLPQIIEKYNPNIGAHLREVSQVFQDDYEYINNQARVFLSIIGKKQKNGYSLDYKMWRDLPDSLQRETLRVAYENLVGNLEGLELVHLEEVITMLKNRVSEGEKVLFGKLRIAEKYDRIEVVII